jgi:uncharacterized protein (DUF2236 family)
MATTLQQTHTYSQSDVTRRIWGSPEAIMLIFAGSAAEFAVNKAVDWLFFTNALPDEPLERFFETVRFAQAMVFGDERTRRKAIAAVNGAHRHVERKRGGQIPQWAHRDVLYMLIDYGERAHRVIFGPMTPEERRQHFEESVQIGRELNIEGLPESYEEYRRQRAEHLRTNTAHSEHTDVLFASYRKHLGPLRMAALLRLQASLVPLEVRRHLVMKRSRIVLGLLRAYRHLRLSVVTRFLTPVLLPRPYGSQLGALASQ